MDFSIVDVDIYTLNKEHALRLAQAYHLKLPSDLFSQTLADLRQKLALVKENFKKAKRDPIFRELLLELTSKNLVSSSSLQLYPQLEELQKILESPYESVTFAGVTNDDDSNLLDVASNESQVYENKLIIQHEQHLNKIKLLELQNSLPKTDTVSSENHHTDSLPSNNIPSTSERNLVTNAMATNSTGENIPLIKPTVFSGQSHENVLEFLKKFELSARCNRWSDRTKLDLFGTYTSGVAYKWWSDFIDLNPTADWETLKTTFKKSFGHSGLLLDLQTTLDAKLQHENETPMQFLFEIHNLCRQINPNMTEAQIINYTIKGLRPTYFDEVIRMENNNLNDFQDNLSKLEARLQLKQQNARKYNLHYGYDYVQTINNAPTDVNLSHESRGKSVHFDRPFVNTNVRKHSPNRSNTPELLNAISDLTKAVATLNARDSSRHRNGVSPEPNHRNYRLSRRDLGNSRESSPHSRQGQRRFYTNFRAQTPPPNRRNFYNYNHPPNRHSFEPKNNYRQNQFRQNTPSYQNKRHNCDICQMDNHYTRNCFYNSRNTVSANSRKPGLKQDSNQTPTQNSNPSQRSNQNKLSTSSTYQSYPKHICQNTLNKVMYHKHPNNKFKELNSNFTESDVAHVVTKNETENQYNGSTHYYWNQNVQHQDLISRDAYETNFPTILESIHYNNKRQKRFSYNTLGRSSNDFNIKDVRNTGTMENAGAITSFKKPMSSLQVTTGQHVAATNPRTTTPTTRIRDGESIPTRTAELQLISTQTNKKHDMATLAEEQPATMELTSASGRHVWKRCSPTVNVESARLTDVTTQREMPENLLRQQTAVGCKHLIPHRPTDLCSTSFHHDVSSKDKSTLLTMNAALKLSTDIDIDNNKSVIKSFNLRNLIKTGQRESNTNLSDIYDILFTTEEPKAIPTLCLKVKIKGISESINCYLDTGTNYSCISDRLVKNLPLNTHNLPNIIAANSKPVKVIGKIDLTILINGKEYETNLIVIQNLSLDLIIGNRFLLANSIEISFKDKEVRIINRDQIEVIKMDEVWTSSLLNHNTISTLTDSLSNSDQMTELRTDREYIIAPKQHLKILDLPDASMEFEFEENLNLRDRRKLHGYIGIDFNTKQKFLQVYNSSSSPKKLKQNALLGYLKTTAVISNDNVETRISKPVQSDTHKIEIEDYITLLDPDKIPVFDKNGEPLNISPHLTVEQHNKVADVLMKYRHMFTNKTEDLDEAKIPPVRLQLKDDAKPTFIPPYRQSFSEKKLLQDEIDKLIQANVLEEATGYTEFQSPIFLVHNKDGTKRLISDLRAVNRNLLIQQFPMMSIDTVLSCMTGMEYFCKLDVKNSFFQIKIDPRDKHILTVASETGKYVYNRLPQGLAISTAAFQRAINKILSKHLFSRCLSYIDDISVFGKTFEQQLENLDMILHELNLFNIKLNTKKTQFMAQTIDMLGHEISKEGTRPLKRNLDAISKINRPTTIRQLRSALGAFNFFRNNIKNFAEIALPLTDAIKEYNKTKELKWTQDCENAFNELKTVLTSAPLLSHFNEDLETRVYTDASYYAIGAILCNYNPETGVENPIQYLSKKLKPSQLSLTTSEKEYLALCYSLLKWREFCYGRKVHVFTDHSALQFYKNFKGSSSRLTRLSLHIVDYDLEVHHKSGKTLTLPDYLSRNPLPNEEIETDIINTDSLNALIHVDLHQLQVEDEDLQEVMSAIEDPGQATKKNKKRSEDFIMHHGILYKRTPGINRNYVIALPQHLKQEVLREFHDSAMAGAHLNADKTYQKIKDRYYWKSMRKDIEQYVKSCDSCQKRKVPNLKPPGLLNPIPPTLIPFTRIQADIIGPICPSNRYKYILCITCVSTRFAFAFPLVSADAQSVAKCLLKLINTYGVFSILQSDRGTTFSAHVIHQLHTSLGNCQILSSAFSPNVNGLVEAFNKTLINIISHYVSEQPTKWSYYLPQAVFAYNNTPHSSHNYKPSYLFLGFTPKLPSDTLLVLPGTDKDLLENLKIIENVRKTVPHLIKKEQEKQKFYYDQRRRNLDLKAGDEVLVWYPKNLRDNTTKFSNKYKGPFLITRKLTPVSYEVEIFKHGRLIRDNIHVQRLKPYYRRSHNDTQYCV